MAAGPLVRLLALRTALVAFISIVAGGIVYVVLPVPSAAAPGLAMVEVAPTPTVRPGLVAGLIDGDDLLTDPIGISTASPTTADGTLIGWPVTDHTPSTGFGYRSDPFTHKQRWHDGVDLGQPCGDAVHASLDGTVAYAGWAGGYGNRIILRHADRDGRSFATTYNHLSKIEVGVGDVVKQDAVIARIGSTGRSTACHLHFEVILDGSYVDPMRFLTGDQSKVSLSRRVGSYMPSGLPSPAPTTTSASPSPSPTPSVTTKSPTPTPTVTHTPTPSPTPTPTPTLTPTPTATLTPTPAPASTQTASPTPAGTQSASPTPAGTSGSHAASGSVTASGSSATATP